MHNPVHRHASYTYQSITKERVKQRERNPLFLSKRRTKIIEIDNKKKAIAVFNSLQRANNQSIQVKLQAKKYSILCVPSFIYSPFIAIVYSLQICNVFNVFKNKKYKHSSIGFVFVFVLKSFTNEFLQLFVEFILFLRVNGHF